MRILMVSPHPVYTPRGTPISVYNRCRALSELGHEIDLVTYPIGEDLPVDGVRYVRAKVPGISKVAIGPSLAKIPLDLAVLLLATWMLIRKRSQYDVVHCHEEAGILVFVAKLLRVPHVYDMGNDLGVVLQNYGLGRRNPVTLLVSATERAIVRSSDVVIVHFPELQQTASRWSPSTPAEVVYNIALDRTVDEADAEDLRTQWAPDGEPLIVYTGTFEPYQGLDNLVEALTQVGDPFAKLVLIGGTPAQQEHLRLRAESLGVRGRLVLPGVMAPEQMPACLEAATILASPRVSGTNTPLKLFGYLASGRPILATRIVSHTQILTDDCAVLVDADPAALAKGIDRLLTDEQLRRELAEAGLRLAEASYSPQAYVEAVRRSYAHLSPVPN